jgi:hypothetical protein
MKETGAPISGGLISPDGLWLADDSSVSLNLVLTDDIDLHPDYDAPLFAVKNLGFVRFQQDGPLLEIIVHPRNVEWPAVRAAIPAIMSSGAALFRITHLAELEWQQETVHSARDASTRLLELCAAFINRRAIVLPG